MLLPVVQNATVYLGQFYCSFAVGSHLQNQQMVFHHFYFMLNIVDNYHTTFHVKYDSLEDSTQTVETFS